MKRQVLPATLVLLWLILSPAAAARAQAPGYAEITSPGAGAVVQGLTSIEGSADHPAFQRYDLAFAYDPNPTDTWFPIGEPVSTRARQAVLGLWDTSEITPGQYQVRLRVFLEGGTVLEDIATGLRLGLPAAAPLPSQPAAVATALPAARPTASLPLPATEPAPARDPMLTALTIGGVMAAALLVVLAAFVPLRRGLAQWAGDLRMRRVLRQEARRRRPGRGAR